MECLSFLCYAPLARFHRTESKPSTSRAGRPTPRHPLVRALKGPRGFGPASPQKTRNRKRKKKRSAFDYDDDEEEGEEEGEEEEDDGTIPEVVTNRMMRRMGVSIGIPLALGLLFFPLFYYLKVVAKVYVPSWLPILVSFVFFGAALLGVSYGIVSASWEPLRQGSLLGWNEARRNWPVFWQSLMGRNK